MRLLSRVLMTVVVAIALLALPTAVRSSFANPQPPGGNGSPPSTACVKSAVAKWSRYKIAITDDWSPVTGEIKLVLCTNRSPDNLDAAYVSLHWSSIGRLYDGFFRVQMWSCATGRKVDDYAMVYSNGTTRTSGSWSHYWSTGHRTRYRFVIAGSGDYQRQGLYPKGVFAAWGTAELPAFKARIGCY